MRLKVHFLKHFHSTSGAGLQERVSQRPVHSLPMVMLVLMHDATLDRVETWELSPGVVARLAESAPSLAMSAARWLWTAAVCGLPAVLR
ncbi:hypothetical protein RFN29_34490 [Mesorhizobium sp. VK22B]|uniref:Uncharacterized protein n=1 Tax=Mesorhizobium captivum TaxID=3072319 RepID=A0ABU4ZDH5_9HYPH|nr:hypothetical protein [Mesorhizobium sp. VK22B]MDX8496613.1 hypothetical protein [Mesorhizobium sp. VK22B]